MHFIYDLAIYSIPFLIGLSVLVFVHELGHYVFARINGVDVKVFSIGFGKELFGFNDKRGTRWKISLIPVGGYVMMAGDKSEASAPDSKALEKMDEESYNKTLFSKSPIQKIMVYAGGSIGNYLYAFLVIAIIFFLQGIPDNRVIIQDVIKGSPAEDAGVLAGDIIEKIDDKKVSTPTMLQSVIEKLSNEQVLNLGIKRGQESFELHVTPKVIDSPNSVNNKTVLGVVFSAKNQKQTDLFGALKASLAFCGKMSVGILESLTKLIKKGEGVKELGGPIKIATLFGDISKSGEISQLVFFSAVLSINLGLINLLPLPALDGGSIFISLIEVVIRRPINKKLQGTVMYFGFVLLMLLMLFITYNDIKNLGIVKRLVSVLAG